MYSYNVNDEDGNRDVIFTSMTPEQLEESNKQVKEFLEEIDTLQASLPDDSQTE